MCYNDCCYCGRNLFQSHSKIHKIQSVRLDDIWGEKDTIKPPTTRLWKTRISSVHCGTHHTQLGGSRINPKAPPSSTVTAIHKKYYDVNSISQNCRCHFLLFFFNGIIRTRVNIHIRTHVLMLVETRQPHTHI